MKKKYFIPVMFSLLALNACDYNEDNFEGLEEISRPSNVAKITYTLTDADYEEIGGDIKTNKYFSADNMPDDYLPGWLADKYYTVDAGSTANITYRFKTVKNEFNDIPYTLLAGDDYNIVHGAGYYAPYLNAKTVGKMYKILNEKFADADKGSYAFVEYQYSEDGVPQQMDAPLLQQTFEDEETGDLTQLDGWFVSATGNEWELKEYSKNKYVQYSANKAEKVCDAWLVTPGVKLEDDQKKLAWDVTVGYWNADCLSVLISTDFDGKDVNAATWDDITSSFSLPQEPTSGYGTFAQAGIASLDKYAGKTVYVAFHYQGDPNAKKTTTYQIDNVVIGNDIPIPVKTELRFALYEHTGKGWYEFENSSKAQAIPVDAYVEMGAPADDHAFSSTVKAEQYIPNYLLKNVAYPLNGDTCTVIYRYYAGSGNYEAHSDQYVYNDSINIWKYTDNVITQTRPYGFTGSEWVYSPSVVIDLPVEKNNAEVSLFYQTITDWVKENHPEYVTSYGNNDYYYGGSAYQNNFDFRPAKWIEQGTYEGMSQADIEELMWERLPEAFPHALEVLYPNAAPAENGIDVIYTINFGVYNGSGTTMWTIQYKVVEKGKFEYIEDSLKEKA